MQIETRANAEYVISEYSNQLKSIFGDYILVKLIHQNNDICFNSSNREILYALQDFLPSEYTIYSECIFGKAVSLPLKFTPSIPPIEHILKRYEYHYYNRLSILDRLFEKNKHIQDMHKNLMVSKDYLHTNTFAYNALYIPLPRYILNQILSFLEFLSFQKTIALRNEYEKLRKYDLND